MCKVEFSLFKILWKSLARKIIPSTFFKFFVRKSNHKKSVYIQGTPIAPWFAKLTVNTIEAEGQQYSPISPKCLKSPGENTMYCIECQKSYYTNSKKISNLTYKCPNNKMLSPESTTTAIYPIWIIMPFEKR